MFVFIPREPASLPAHSLARWKDFPPAPDKRRFVFERRFSIGCIPALAIAVDDSLDRPVVLFYHGLHSHKDQHRAELESLAARGWLALGIDAVGHGERSFGDLHEFLELGHGREQIVRLLHAGLEEVPLLLDWLTLRGYRRFALVGISFGGFLAFGAAVREPRLSSVVSVVGCPDWGAGSNATLRWSPHSEPQALARSPLLAWNAGRDTFVDTARTRQVMGELRGVYREFPESDHFFRPEDWAEGWQLTLDWISEKFEAPPLP